MLAANQRDAGAEVRAGGRRSPSPSPTAIVSCQLPPGPLRPAPTTSARPTARRPTPPASASAWSGSRSRSSARTASTRRAGPTSVRASCGADVTARPCWTAAGPGGVPAARASTRRARGWPRDQLLRRSLDRAAPRLGLEPAGGAGVRAGHRLRGRPVDVLQAAARRTSSALYGVEIQELAVWRPLAEHVAEQLGRGRTADRRGRRLLSARHRRRAYRHRRTRRPRSRVTRSTPTRGGCGYFHNAGLVRARGRRLRRGAANAAARQPAPCCPPTPSW